MEPVGRQRRRRAPLVAFSGRVPAQRHVRAVQRGDVGDVRVRPRGDWEIGAGVAARRFVGREPRGVGDGRTAGTVRSLRGAARVERGVERTAGELVGGLAARGARFHRAGHVSVLLERRRRRRGDWRESRRTCFYSRFHSYARRRVSPRTHTAVRSRHGSTLGQATAVRDVVRASPRVRDDENLGEASDAESVGGGGWRRRQQHAHERRVFA